MFLSLAALVLLGVLLEEAPRRPRALELFAGAGGAALGLRRAGFEAVACVDNAPAAVATLRAAGFPGVLADVGTLDLAPYRGVDLVWGSPPCQPGSRARTYTTQGVGGAADARNGWPAFFRALDIVQPRVAVAENVLGWTRHAEGCRGQTSGTPHSAIGSPLGQADSGQRTADSLSCLGCYWSDVVLPGFRARFPWTGEWHLDAADFGVPQRRRRTFLVGARYPLAAPKPTHGSVLQVLSEGRLPWQTLGSALGLTLRSPTRVGVRYPRDGSCGRAGTEPERLLLPAPTVTTSEEKGTRASAISGWTFHGGPDRASDAAFLALGIRRLSYREAAVLQGFPPDYPFTGNDHEKYVQVGNAVAVAVAEAVGRAVQRS